MAHKAKVRLIAACLIVFVFMIGEVIGELFLGGSYCEQCSSILCNLIGQVVISKSHRSVCGLYI